MPSQTGFVPDQTLQLRGKCITKVFETFKKQICTIICFCHENTLGTINLIVKRNGQFRTLYNIYNISSAFFMYQNI